MSKNTPTLRSHFEQMRTALRIAILFCVHGSFSGCTTPWEKSALLKDSTPNIARVQGPTERGLRNLLSRRNADEANDSDSLKPLAGTDEYVAATEIYKKERYANAQKAFQKVAKKYKKSDIREDALFMQAEAAFHQEHYSNAHDNYAVLLKEYPSTRHLDVVSERLFKIGRVWLDFPEVAKLSEVQQVNYADPKRKLPPTETVKSTAKPVFVPNFSNRAEPLFDTPGNGVAALQAIWMNDPTGPLADDAMMLVASHHARHGNFVEADRFFQMLRETFPNSPHLHDAFLLGSHVKLMSYQGAEYEGKTLTEAKLLKESTLRLYPDSEDNERLEKELTEIDEAMAEREWQQVLFWLGKGNKRAAAVYSNNVINQFPKSRFADKARSQLEDLGPEYASGLALLTPTDPKKKTFWERALPQLTTQRSSTPATAIRQRADDPANGESSSRRMRNDSSTGDDSEEIPANDDSPLLGVDPGKKRGWFDWSPPRKLPAETDSEARKIDSPESDSLK